MSDVGPVDSVSGLNLRTRPPDVRYVVSSDSFHCSNSYYEGASLVRSAADVPVVTVAATTTVDANVAAGLKAKDAAKDFEHIGDSASVGGVDADAVSIYELKMSISSHSFYASQSLDTETMHRVYVPRWKLRAMDYDQLYSEFNVGAARQVCLGAEVRMRAEHTLERKGKLEDRCAGQATLILEKDAEIAHLRSLLSLKGAAAAKAISLRSQLSVVEAADAAKGTELRDLKEKNFALEGEKNVLSERVETLESVVASKEVELASLSSQVSNLTVDLSGFQLSHDELSSKKNSLESAFELFKEQVEKMQDEQVGSLSDRVTAIDSDLMEMALHMDAKFYPRYLTIIARRRWILSRGLKLVLAKCLSSHEYLSAMGEAIGRAIDKEVAHTRVQRLRGDAAARRLSLMDSILPLIEPLSARNVTGESSSSADFTTAMTTALSTTFAQTYLVSVALSTEVPSSPKVVFEEEELDTTPEHVPAP
ncbi:hypothetical protein Tco_1095167 [Tanacetum coccineum]